MEVCMRGLLLLFVCAVMVGCGAHAHRHIGTTMKPEHITEVGGYPTRIEFQQDGYDVAVSIDRGEGTSNFKASGEFKATTNAPERYARTNVSLLLSNRGGVVCEDVLAAQTRGRDIRVSGDIVCDKPFDGATIWYSLRYWK